MRRETARTYQGEQKIVYFHHGGTEVTEKKIFSLPGGIGKEKVFQPHRGHLVANGLRLMENRHLPILHKKFSSVSSVSRTSHALAWRVGGEHRLECKLFSAPGNNLGKVSRDFDKP